MLHYFLWFPSISIKAAVSISESTQVPFLAVSLHRSSSLSYVLPPCGGSFETGKSATTACSEWRRYNGVSIVTWLAQCAVRRYFIKVCSPSLRQSLGRRRLRITAIVKPHSRRRSNTHIRLAVSTHVAPLGSRPRSTYRGPPAELDADIYHLWSVHSGQQSIDRRLSVLITIRECHANIWRCSDFGWRRTARRGDVVSALFYRIAVRGLFSVTAMRCTFPNEYLAKLRSGISGALCLHRGDRGAWGVMHLDYGFSWKPLLV